MRVMDGAMVAGLSIVRYDDKIPGECCIECARPLELAGAFRIGGFFYHLSSPDLVCDDCAHDLRPDLVAELARGQG